MRNLHEIDITLIKSGLIKQRINPIVNVMLSEMK